MSSGGKIWKVGVCANNRIKLHLGYMMGNTASLSGDNCAIYQQSYYQLSSPLCRLVHLQSNQRWAARIERMVHTTPLSEWTPPRRNPRSSVGEHPQLQRSALDVLINDIAAKCQSGSGRARSLAMSIPSSSYSWNTIVGPFRSNKDELAQKSGNSYNFILNNSQQKIQVPDLHRTLTQQLHSKR